uniref:Uncharacterized protein n=1 Tax=Romanomermis culicivorax TaxID=13658 RepID=A0A915K8R6_ROMCU
TSSHKVRNIVFRKKQKFNNIFDEQHCIKITPFATFRVTTCYFPVTHIDYVTTCYFPVTHIDYACKVQQIWAGKGDDDLYCDRDLEWVDDFDNAKDNGMGNVFQEDKPIDYHWLWTKRIFAEIFVIITVLQINQLDLDNLDSLSKDRQSSVSEEFQNIICQASLELSTPRQMKSNVGDMVEEAKALEHTKERAVDLNNKHQQEDWMSKYFAKGKRAFDDNNSRTKLLHFWPATISMLNSFIVKEQVIMAEIKWALKSISNQFSFRSCAGISNLFKSMFPDMCFDKALNKVAQHCQLDVLVRYFGPKGELLKDVKVSSSRYKAPLEEQSRQKLAKGATLIQKRKPSLEIKELEMKRKRVQEESSAKKMTWMLI